MSESEVCGLCVTSPASTKRVHAYGVKLCESCFLGNVEGLVVRGIHVRSEIYERRSGSRSVFRHVVEATAKGTDPAQITFQQSSFLDRLLAKVGSTVAAGDPLFDDHVIVRTAKTPFAEALVANDGVQTAVLEIVQLDTLRVVGGATACEFVRDEPDQPAMKELARNVAIVLHHAQRLSAS